MKTYFLTLVICVAIVYVGLFIGYPELFFEDRGMYVKKELCEKNVLSLPKDEGEILSASIVPVGGDFPVHNKVLLCRTEKSSIVCTLDGIILSKSADNTVGGVYYNNGLYVPMTTSVRGGISYKQDGCTIYFERFETLFLRDGFQVKACENTGNYENYKIKHLEEGQLEIEKTYEYVWQSDIHFVPFKIFS